MNRMTKLLAGICLLFGVAAFGQDVQSTHPFPEDAFSTQELVAWSHLQTPQPAPKPLPVPDTQVPRPDQQRASSEAQLFVGKIVRDSGKFVLQVANSTYGLEGEVDSRAENQVVRILGNRDASGKIHVLKIETLS
jgi:hypothetical protein